MCHDWPVTNAIVELPIKMKENSKLSSSNSSSPLGAQNKDKGAALQMLLTQVKITPAMQASYSALVCSA